MTTSGFQCGGCNQWHVGVRPDLAFESPDYNLPEGEEHANAVWREFLRVEKLFGEAAAPWVHPLITAKALNTFSYNTVLQYIRGREDEGDEEKADVRAEKLADAYFKQMVGSLLSGTRLRVDRDEPPAKEPS